MQSVDGGISLVFMKPWIQSPALCESSMVCLYSSIHWKIDWREDSQWWTNSASQQQEESTPQELNTDSFLEALFIVTQEASLASQFPNTPNLSSDRGLVLKEPSPNQFSAIGDCLVCQACLQTKLSTGSWNISKEHHKISDNNHWQKTTSKPKCHYSRSVPDTTVLLKLCCKLAHVCSLRS